MGGGRCPPNMAPPGANAPNTRFPLCHPLPLTGTPARSTGKRRQNYRWSVPGMPERLVRPSVDYLLRSVTQVLDGNALAIIMTGMGCDGVDGCRALKQAGGWVFAQHQDDCIVYGMPKAVIEQGLADRILPLGKIAPAIVRHLNRGRRA